MCVCVYTVGDFEPGPGGVSKTGVVRAWAKMFYHLTACVIMGPAAP